MDFAVETHRLDDKFRITRFVRDPRDLVVSGYYYHNRGAEPWFRFKTPTLKYWSPINGNVPPDMPEGISFAEYLQSLSEEDGLIAEIQFRKFQFESIRHWPQDKRIKIYKYEEILGQEAEVFDDIFRFFELPAMERKLAVWLSRRYALTGKKHNSKHVRNSSPGQWRKHFSDKVETYFNTRYKDTLKHLNYE